MTHWDASDRWQLSIRFLFWLNFSAYSFTSFRLHLALTLISLYPFNFLSQQRQRGQSSAEKAGANQSTAADRLRWHAEAHATVQSGRQKSRLHEEKSSEFRCFIRAQHRLARRKHSSRRASSARRGWKQSRTFGGKSIFTLQRSFSGHQVVRNWRHCEEFPRSWNCKLLCQWFSNFSLRHFSDFFVRKLLTWFKFKKFENHWKKRFDHKSHQHCVLFFRKKTWIGAVAIMTFVQSKFAPINRATTSQTTQSTQSRIASATISCLSA